MEEQEQKYSLMEDVLSLLELLQKDHIEIGQLSEHWEELDLLPASDPEHVWTACETLRFMDEMPGGFLIYYADHGEQIIHANKGLLRIFQCRTMQEFREWTGNSFRGIVHPEDLDMVEQSIQRQIAVNQFNLDYVEYRITRKDGEVRWIEDYGHFIHSETIGNIFYVFLWDATEKRNRHLIEKAMLIQEKEQKEQTLQNLIEEYDKERTLIKQEHLRRLEVIEGLSINYESIFYADLDRDTILPYRLSTRTELQFGEKFQERSFAWYTREYTAAWVHPEDREIVAEATSPAYIREMLSKNVTYYINYRVIEDQETLYLQLRIVNAGNKDQLSQIVMGYRRVDEEIQREMEQKQILTEALSSANLASTVKDTFLSNMSHDMRTPLNAIFGFTALAKKNAHDAPLVEHYLERVEASSRQLLDLIDKLLELSWTGSNEARLTETECDLCSIAQEVHKALLPQARDKNISFSVFYEGLEHEDIYGDRDKLKQLLLYLASNAVAYTTPGGQVTLTVREQEKLPNGCACYQFIVKDTGIGISEEFLDHIFEPFARERNTTLSGIHGVGLGLTIAKSIVDRMGGRIEAASTMGEGSTFTVTLRLRIQTRPLSSRPGTGESAPALQHILLVEDNEINLEIETELLQELGFSVETAADGKAAVEKLERAAPGEYDLILMDLQMPVMDGWNAARAIRKIEDPALSRIPIVALSANVLESDVRKSMESGMDAHLAKPIDVALLLKTMEEVRQKHAGQAADP